MLGNNRPYARVRTMILAAGLVVLSGCTDAAEEDFKRCEQLDKERKFEEALVACQQAQEKDARSPAGKRAIALESKLLDKIVAMRKEKAEAEAENAESAALDKAHAKVIFNLVSTPPNDPQGYSERCMARNRAYENSYHCDPKDPESVGEGVDFPFKDECMLVAESRGCMPFFEENPTKLFCCTK